MIDSQIVSSPKREKRGIRTRWSLLALAMGTFCFGMTEYVMMAILPDMARDFHVSIPQAGHLISSYALGVCVGAPLLAMLGRTWPLRRILLVLMAIRVRIAHSVEIANTMRQENNAVIQVPKGMPIRFATVIPEHINAMERVTFSGFEMREATRLPTPKKAPWGIPAKKRATSITP